MARKGNKKSFLLWMDEEAKNFIRLNARHYGFKSMTEFINKLVSDGLVAFSDKGNHEAAQAAYT